MENITEKRQNGENDGGREDLQLFDIPNVFVDTFIEKTVNGPPLT